MKANSSYLYTYKIENDRDDTKQVKRPYFHCGPSLQSLMSDFALQYAFKDEKPNSPST